MKGGRRLIWALLLLLGLAAFTFFAARDESQSRPSANSTYPSGLGALRELLVSEGYPVRVDRTERPRVSNTGLVIVPTNENVFDRKKDEDQVTIRALEDWLEDGGTLLEIRVPKDFGGASAKAREEHVAEAGADTAVPVTVGNRVSSPLDFTVTSRTLDLWGTDSQPVVEIAGVSKGIYASSPTGLLFTNRFLGRADNAEVALDVISRLNPGRKPIVFVEAIALGAEQTGIAASLGPWAVTTWWQIVLTILVALIAFGWRFGLPERDLSGQRSGRHLVDAFAGVLKRGKKDQFAAEILAREALDRARVMLRLPVGTHDEAVLKDAPPEFLVAHQRITNGGPTPISRGELVHLVDQLHRALQDRALWDGAKL